MREPVDEGTEPDALHYSARPIACGALHSPTEAMRTAWLWRNGAASREIRTATVAGTDAACGGPREGGAMASILQAGDLDSLFGALRDRGYRVVGPTVRDGAIVYADIESAAALPSGWTDEQAPAKYRLARRDDEALFGYAVGPHLWKAELLPPAGASGRRGGRTAASPSKTR